MHWCCCWLVFMLQSNTFFFNINKKKASNRLEEVELLELMTKQALDCKCLQHFLNEKYSFSTFFIQESPSLGIPSHYQREFCSHFIIHLSLQQQINNYFSQNNAISVIYIYDFLAKDMTF